MLAAPKSKARASASKAHRAKVDAGPSVAPVPAHPVISAPPRPYIFGAVCPQQGKGAALILPAGNTEAMNLHLAEIAKTVAPGAHAVLLVDQAGWHMSTRLVVPPNITIVALPPKFPELNPVENVWQYMRDNWLSNRIFKPYDSSTIAAKHGTSSSINHGASCPSDCANGRTGSDQWDLV